jgi:transposase
VEDAQATRLDAQKSSLRAAEQARADVAQARRAWRELQPRLNPRKLVFLDETWAKTNMTRLYGRSPRGRRLVAAAPFGQWNTSTLIAALQHDGIVAPMVLDGALNGRAFLAWVRHFLAPTLRAGDFVVADKLASHKVAGVRDAIGASGASLLFLPAYSPDLNPIEQAFAKVKAWLRRAEPRTRDELWRTVGSALEGFAPDECRNHLRHCGYAHPQ